ncbi:alkaline phosphatase D family protein [Halioxenophilus sp. WMMB6]|uniref:alkaline phosphatase D family protein n=1 Tax=Halioxenophilus sp. WMMB6 TaxID=3073815 RepID=UPI00295ED3D3|nr:alkaline phosphatase D family protein [Halioxenophilus sp. WMMB6]
MKRREFLGLSLAGLGLTGCQSYSLAISETSDPTNTPASVITGISSGDISPDGAVIWSRCNTPALMHVEVSADPGFGHITQFTGSAALAPTDFNAKTVVTGLLPGQTWFYRVRFESLLVPGSFSEPLYGQFKTAPVIAGDLRFCWSGDTAGQGFGVDAERGGMLTYQAMRQQEPDFFVHCGDLIYADNPIPATIDLPDGTVWHNLVTPGKSKVAETIQDFRENYYYNFLDTHFVDFHRHVATLQMWDDHEIRNNWYPGQILTDERYQEKSVSVLAEYSRRAMFDCNPIRVHTTDARRIYRKVAYGPGLDLFLLDMRTYRGPNSENLQAEAGPETTFLGAEQLQWLKAELSRSTATWKIIVADMPIGLQVKDWGTDIAENLANHDGPPLGREFEMVELLSHLKQQQINNVHFITADVHYCASHYYDPQKAQFKDFNPFWEFVSGPLHAGTFGPSKLDDTFGPQVVFHGLPDDFIQGSAPSVGYQFFGQMEISGTTGELTVSHFNRAGEQLWQITLQPA